jgi:hypothetical protein
MLNSDLIEAWAASFCVGSFRYVPDLQITILVMVGDDSGTFGE